MKSFDEKILKAYLDIISESSDADFAIEKATLSLRDPGKLVFGNKTAKLTATSLKDLVNEIIKFINDNQIKTEIDNIANS